MASAGMSLMAIAVLIETYWNVKLETIDEWAALEPSINRNILECKGKKA